MVVENVPLSRYTRFGLGGPARRLVDASTPEDLAAALHPEHGTLIMNLHGGGRPAPSLGRMLGAVFGRRAPTPGYDPTSAAGAAVQQAAMCFRYGASIPSLGFRFSF